MTFATTIVTRFEIEAEAQNAALSDTSARLEAVGRQLEKSTDGYDKLRSAVDATTDRLRLFGTRARGLADSIDDHITDPIERSRLALAHFERISNRVPGRLDKMSDAIGRGRVAWSAFLERIGPAGQLIGGVAAGAVAALAVAIGRELVVSVQRYLETDAKLQASVARTEGAMDRLRLTVGRLATEAIGAESGITAVGTALDTLRNLLEDVDAAAGTFRLGVKALAGSTGLGALIGPLQTAVRLWRELVSLAGGDPSLAAPITPPDGGPRRLTFAPAPPEPGIGRGSTDAPAVRRRGGGGGGRRADTSQQDAVTSGFAKSLDDIGRAADANVQALQRTTAGIDSATASTGLLAAGYDQVTDGILRSAEAAREFAAVVEGVKLDAINGLAGALQSAFGALAAGESGFDAMAASSLRAVAQIAGQWGAMLLAYGAGVSLIPGLNIGSGAAIAGGVGLLAVAGAAGALASSVGGGGRSGGGRGATAAAAPPPIAPRGLLAERGDESRSTVIQVYLDGDEIAGGGARVVNRMARLGLLDFGGST